MHGSQLTRIGDYDVGAPLGVGTVGTVYRATRVDDGREVALKILHPAVTHDANVVRRFHRETEILERLRHPNIVEYVESGKHGDQLWYTMELVEGKSLKEILVSKGRLDWKDAVEAGWQVSSALQYAHNQGIVHRDLKPANLFLGRDGKLKLGDFGIALDTGAADITATGLTVGSYMYMAPEQIRGERGINNQTDLYAFGCLLYEMLTGEPPYRGVNFAQIFDQHLSKPPPSVLALNPDCPPELERIVHHLLAKDPLDRPFNAREVQGLLADVLMAWDEEQPNDTTLDVHKLQGDGHRQVTINRSEPILAELLHDTGRYEFDVSWGTLACILGITCLLIVVAAMSAG